VFHRFCRLLASDPRPQFFQGPGQLRAVSLGGLRPPGDNQKIHRRQVMTPNSKLLPNHPPNPVAIHCPAGNPSGNDLPEPGCIGWGVMDRKKAIAAGSTVPKNTVKRRPGQQSGTSGKILPWSQVGACILLSGSRHGHVSHRNRPGCRQATDQSRRTAAARRLRPLARRALIIARPPRVAMRARNPCRRTRLIRLG